MTLRWDTFQEILSTIKKNKLRTFLTCFSVAWGIFILILLLGVGTGLERGVQKAFSNDAVNSVWIQRGQTSKPFRGLQPGRRIEFTNEDYQELKQSLPGIEHISSRFYVWGNNTITYQQEFGSFNIISAHPEHLDLEKTEILQGRFLNALDQEQGRKVAVIGNKVQAALFKGKPVLGEFIGINGIRFKVVGIFTEAGEQWQQNLIYLPISTAQGVFNGKNQVHVLGFSTGNATTEESIAMEESARRLMAGRHHFDVSDARAIHLSNNWEEYLKYMKLFGGIRIFIWIIGVGTIVAGIVGVSNIMVIAVKERTREIGIRKALGATPWSIIELILTESIVITVLSGYFGLLLGVAVLEVMAVYMPPTDYFYQPAVDLKIAFSALVLLVVAGSFAGLVPARKAAYIKPIEALYDE